MKRRDDSLMSQLTGQRAAHEMRRRKASQSRPERSSARVVRTWTSETGECRQWPVCKVSEDLPEHVQVMRDALQIALGEEREARETTFSEVGDPGDLSLRTTKRRSPG